MLKLMKNWKKIFNLYFIISIIVFFSLLVQYLVKVEKVGFFTNYMTIGPLHEQIAYLGGGDDPTMKGLLISLYIILLINTIILIVHVWLSRHSWKELLSSTIGLFIISGLFIIVYFSSNIYVFYSRTWIITLFYIVPSILVFMITSINTYLLFR